MEYHHILRPLVEIASAMNFLGVSLHFGEREWVEDCAPFSAALANGPSRKGATKMYDNDLNFGKGKLYSALPIPAYKALAKAKEWPAQRVLIGLMSFAGKNTRCVFPSYTKLSQITGMTRSTVSKGLKTLAEYELIKVFRFYKDGKLHNKYYLQDACWDSSRLKGALRQYTKKVAMCDACGKSLNRGEFGIGPDWAVHWGCGGFIIPFGSYQEILDHRMEQAKIERDTRYGDL
jgi:hypothetical protein